MARRESYEEKTEALLMPMLTEHQFELVDVEFVKEAGTWFLRAYIDKPGGIGYTNSCPVWGGDGGIAQLARAYGSYP